MRSTLYTITLSNYRCFSREAPATFDIGDGITAFVGKNNAGKSALLRFFHEFRGALPQFGTSIQNNAIGVTHGRGETTELFTRSNDGDMVVTVECPPPADGHLMKTRQSTRVEIERARNVCCRQRFNNSDKPYNDLVFAWQNRQSAPVDGDFGEPCLDIEGLGRDMNLLANTLYIHSHRNAVGDLAGRYFDLPTGRDFVNEWVGHKNGLASHLRDKSERVEEDVRRLMRFRSFDLRPVNNEPTLFARIDGRDYLLDNIGAGVSQLIVLLATVAIRSPQFLFIDEPEAGLHPSLQLDLLTTLAGYVKGNLVFATHNIGLARAATRRIYSVERQVGGTSRVHPLEETPTLAQLLGELQYGAYSQVGGRRVLLVEGPDDVLVFQQFLRKHNADHNVIVLSLGGTSLIRGDSAVHLEEVKRICPDVGVVIDSERKSKGDPISQERQTFLQTCNALGFCSHVTDRRATEHYLTQQALDRAFGQDASRPLRNS